MATSSGIDRVCATMRDGIKFLKQEIKQKESQIDILTARLRKLQSQSDPNSSAVKEIKDDIQKLENELVNDRAQLNAFEEEVSASCPPA